MYGWMKIHQMSMRPDAVLQNQGLLCAHSIRQHSRTAGWKSIFFPTVNPFQAGFKSPFFFNSESSRDILTVWNQWWWSSNWQENYMIYCNWTLFKPTSVSKRYLFQVKTGIFMDQIYELTTRGEFEIRINYFWATINFSTLRFPLY